MELGLLSFGSAVSTIPNIHYIRKITACQLFRKNVINLKNLKIIMTNTSNGGIKMCKCLKAARLLAFFAIMVSALKTAVQIAKSASLILTASKVIKKIG